MVLILLSFYPARTFALVPSVFPNPLLSDLPDVLTHVDAEVQHRLLQFIALGESGKFFFSNDPEIQQTGNAVHFDVCAGRIPGDTHNPPFAPALTVVKFTITDPLGTEFNLIVPDVYIDAFTCHRFETTDFARDNLHRHSLDLTIPGTYTEQIQGLYYKDTTCLCWDVGADFVISAFVVPESPIGNIALMGSSFAALGGFIFWKRRNKNNITD